MAYDEQEYTKSFDIKVWKSLLPYLKPYRRTLLLVFIFNMVCALIDILLPLFQRHYLHPRRHAH